MPLDERRLSYTKNIKCYHIAKTLPSDAGRKRSFKTYENKGHRESMITTIQNPSPKTPPKLGPGVNEQENTRRRCEVGKGPSNATNAHLYHHHQRSQA